MNFDDLNFDFLKGKAENVKKVIGEKFGEITDDEANKVADEPNKIVEFIKDKFGTPVEDIKSRFEGFNFDEFKDDVTFDEVKDKASDIFNRIKGE